MKVDRISLAPKRNRGIRVGMRAGLATAALAFALSVAWVAARPQRAAACSIFNPICWIESTIDTLTDIIVAIDDLVEEIIDLAPTISSPT